MGASLIWTVVDIWVYFKTRALHPLGVCNTLQETGLFTAQSIWGCGTCNMEKEG